ncbi:MAG TPA: hypothetical protein VL022_09065 [Moheibacter sp.]|nr:hypothetical protein [Moheibacter sp.]
MIFKKKTFILLLTTLGYLVFSQDSETTYHAEVVNIEDLFLIQTLETLISNNKCINERADLYLDYRNEDYLILGQFDLGARVNQLKKKHEKVYMTFLNNHPLFILSKNETILPIKKNQI